MLTHEQIAALQAIVGDDAIETTPDALAAYAADRAFQQSAPEVVVRPRDTAQVSAILRLASQQRIPVTPRGAGTGLTGGATPLAGGILLTLERMNAILEVDPASGTATVQAGVINRDLQDAAARVGLFYPPDPASLEWCTLGGNAACDAGGPHCLKYGVTKDYILGMTVALIDGRVLRLGGKLLKNATGYQLLQLFIGSEGSLGVITELVVRLLPLPRAHATVTALFSDLDDASHAVTAILSSGLLPATLELMDRVTLNAVEDDLRLGLPRAAGAMLLIDQDGSDEAAVAHEAAAMRDLCVQRGAISAQVATDPAERDALWIARRAASTALAKLRPNKLGEDISVPRDQIPAMVRRVGDIAEQHNLVIAVFGHAGDGNLHPNILFDRALPGEMARVEAAAEAILRAALDLGGTLSGEHGIGALKREFLRDALGDDTVDLMQGIKRLFDPQGLLNPGKIFPTQSGSSRAGFLTALPTSDQLLTG